MEPESGSCRVATVRMSELLPAPFGPKRPNMRLPIVSERFFSAFTPLGYVLDRPVIVSAKGTTLRFRDYDELFSSNSDVLHGRKLLGFYDDNTRSEERRVG